MTGHELKAARERLGWSTYWCAKNIGNVSQSTWARWEGGRNGKEIVIPTEVTAKIKALSRQFFLANMNKSSREFKLEVQQS
jgi:DNA-binding XRE family transcriptional regulator